MSNIDPTKPTYGQAYTSSVRQNFQHAKDEIEALQNYVTTFGGPYLPLSGGTLTGPLTLYGNAAFPLQPVTLQQLNATVSGQGPFLPIVGGTLTGPLTLSGNATQNLHAVTLQQLNSTVSGQGPFLPLSGGAITGPVTFNPPPTISDGSGRTATPSMVFTTVAAMIAFNYTTSTLPFAVTCQGYYAPGDGGGGDFTYIPAITKTTSAQTNSGSAILSISNTSTLIVGQLVTATGISPHTFIIRIVPNVSITISKNTTAIVASGATITFNASDPDGGFYLAATQGGQLRRDGVGKCLTMEQAGMKGDYIMPLPYLTTAANNSGDTGIIFSDTTGIQVGWWAHHPSLPFGTTVSAVTTTTVTVNNPVGALGISIGDAVCFNPVATDNTFTLAVLQTATTAINTALELVVAGDRFYYFGITQNAPCLIQAFTHIRGQQPYWTSGRAGAAPSFTGGMVLHPACYIRMNGFTKLSQLCIIRAGLPNSMPNGQTYAKYLDKAWSENGVIANPIVLNTSATAASGNTLTFTATTGVTVGMYATGFGLGESMRVTTVTATQVTFWGNINNQITAGSPISFGSNFRSIGIWFNQGAMELDHVYILGFYVGVHGTSGGHRMNHVYSDCVNGFDISGDGNGTAFSNLRAAADCTAGIVAATMTWNIATDCAIAAGGSKYCAGDLLHDETGNLVIINAVDANGSVTAISPLVWRGGCYKTPPATTWTKIMPRDPQGSQGLNATGLGVGATLAPVYTPYTATQINYLPGRGFYLHDRVDGCAFVDSIATGHHYGWIISNCWITVVRGGYESRLINTLGSGTVGFWTWNSPSWVNLVDIYVGGQEYPVLLENVDAPYATILPKLGQGTITYARMIGPQVSGIGLSALGGNTPQPSITIGSHSRGIITGGGNIVGGGPNENDPQVRIRANVIDWKLSNLTIQAIGTATNWIAIDPTSEDHVSVVNCKFIDWQNSSNPLIPGPQRVRYSGPNDRILWPQQISFDPSSIAPTDNSPASPLTVHSREGGAAVSRNILLARGGQIHDPGICGFLGTSGTGVVLDAMPGTMLITTATVANGGAGYWPGDIIYDPNGGSWTVATVSAIGAVLTVTNSSPAKYVGAAPTNPVTTWTEATGGYNGLLQIGLSGGGVTAGVPIINGTPTPAGYHYYQNRAYVLFGAPGNYGSSAGILVQNSPNPAGVQATATLTVGTSGLTQGAITGVTMTNAGSGYTGTGPTYQILTPPPSGCTLTLGAGISANAVTIAPTAATSILLGNTTGRLGFNGVPAIAKPTVIGAKGSNAALASLLNALASYGLVLDTTTA